MDEQITFEFEQRKPIKGYPELHWTGKRPYTSTQYYPAQLKESYGKSKDGWMNKIFWGDNLQVMSHLLKDYRGKIDLIYIDPPFDSKADYKKQIKIKGIGKVESDSTAFEEKQYGDIWTNDEYLQFMYERLTLMKELLSTKGSIYLHCDWHKAHHLRMIMDEIFGSDFFLNEIIWNYGTYIGQTKRNFPRKHDSIFVYSRTNDYTFNMLRDDDLESDANYKRWRKYFNDNKQICGDNYPEDDTKFSGYVKRFEKENGRKPSLKEDVILEISGKVIDDVWYIQSVNPFANERVGYPTQKPEELIERIIEASSNPGDLVFDCFMGSGTTLAVADKLNRRYIGADINLGSIQVTVKRLLELQSEQDTGFEVYNVNNYDFFRNPLEAKELIINALGIQRYESTSVYDGELDGFMVKIMPVNRIATKADLEELKANVPYKTWEKRKEENPNECVEKIRIICMGHEADLKAALEQDFSTYNVEIEILDILRDKADLQFKRESDAKIEKIDGLLQILEFYPMNLLQKLSMQKENVDNWKQLVESVYIDWNYDGEIMKPSVCDVPGKNELVLGSYKIPEDATRIKVKITDILSESLEMEV